MDASTKGFLINAGLSAFVAWLTARFHIRTAQLKKVDPSGRVSMSSGYTGGPADDGDLRLDLDGQPERELRHAHSRAGVGAGLAEHLAEKLRGPVDDAGLTVEAGGGFNFDGQAVEVTDDQSGKFEFMWNNRDRLKRIKRFILAVDNDTNGKHLANELVRRLSAARCLFVTYPEGCKDLNDVRRAHGPEGVSAVLNAAQPYPVKGLFKLSDYPDLPEVRTFSTGWDTVDELMKLFTPSLTIVTGIPGMGKSTWVTNLMLNAARLHGWKSAVFSPEMPVAPQMRDKMRGMIAGQSPHEMSADKAQRADQWINDNIIFIEHTTEEEEDMTLEWLLDRAADAVLRHGVRIVGFDPWNEIEHSKRRDETMAEYQNRALRAIRRFAIKYDVAVIVVAHPTKDIALGGKPRVPSLYDIDGSAAWANKPDFGVVIHVPDPAIPETMIYVSKVRFRETGQKGSVRMKFDRWTELYSLLDGRSEAKDHYGKSK